MLGRGRGVDPVPSARNLLVTAINAEGGGGSAHVPAAPTLVVGIVAEGGGAFTPTQRSDPGDCHQSAAGTRHRCGGWGVDPLPRRKDDMAWHRISEWGG
jgi:hypothetical protein